MDNMAYIILIVGYIYIYIYIMDNKRDLSGTYWEYE